jgi:hypothetical protein
MGSMSERPDPHADAAVGKQGEPVHPGGSAAHGAAHVDAHGSGHDDGHEGEALGPVDVGMWGAAVLGVALGLVVFLALVYAVS